MGLLNLQQGPVQRQHMHAPRVPAAHAAGYKRMKRWKLQQRTLAQATARPAPSLSHSLEATRPKTNISTTHRASGQETSQPLTSKTSEHLEHTSNTPGTHRDHLRVKNIANWRAFPAPTWKTSEGTKTSSPPRDHVEKRHVTHLEHV